MADWYRCYVMLLFHSTINIITIISRVITLLSKDRSSSMFLVVAGGNPQDLFSRARWYSVWPSFMKSENTRYGPINKQVGEVVNINLGVWLDLSWYLIQKDNICSHRISWLAGLGVILGWMSLDVCENSDTSINKQGRHNNVVNSNPTTLHGNSLEIRKIHFWVKSV